MNRILVIGSNSFSGASFIRYVLNKDATVVGISRSPEPADAMLPYRWDDHKRFRFEAMDLNHDLEKIMTLIEDFQPQLVVNFAAQSMVAESWDSPEDWFQTNVIANVNLHDRLRDCRYMERYVHVSTPEVYGSCIGSVSEKAPYNPTTPYAVSRAACDMSLSSFGRAYDFPVLFTRAANVYGPGQQLYRIIPRTILYIRLRKKLELHGGGTSERSFIHIDDVAHGTWKVAHEGRLGEVYHLSTPELISIKNLVKKICNRLDVCFEDHVDIVDERLGKDAAYILDSAKARKEFNWKDDVLLDDGIDQTIRWIDSNIEELSKQPLKYIHQK
ncbi:MAG: dTDP-glucose 4,6-dehydratase [Elusimicrobia bacterium]|nr:MAG: dTDP-glucose 4,6-dehydratase [Elusimicrobiota bacterium]